MSEPSPSQVDPEERISRYLLRKELITKSRRISPQAFKPPEPKGEQTERQTSVYRTEGCLETEVWDIGDKFVTKLHPERLPVLARADLKAEVAVQLDLRVVPSPTPHYRHANIVNWPDIREERQEKAAVLASKASLQER